MLRRWTKFFVGQNARLPRVKMADRNRGVNMADGSRGGRAAIRHIIDKGARVNNVFACRGTTVGSGFQFLLRVGRSLAAHKSVPVVFAVWGVQGSGRGVVGVTTCQWSAAIL